MDKVFVDTEWLNIFTDMKLWGLKRYFSDHCPLLVDCEKINRGPRPFRALDVWFSNPSFVKMVQGEWKMLGNMPLHTKLKNLKTPLKKWNKEVFGDIDRKVDQQEAEIKILDQLNEEQGLNEMSLARLKALTTQLWLWLKRKEKYWIQLSRMKALNEKDRNTKYFHLMASVRRGKKIMGRLKMGNRIIKDPKSIKKIIIKYFKDLYVAGDEVDVRYDGNRFSKLLQNQKEELELIPSREEIKRAVWSYESSKAPGNDGFNLGFVKKMWNVVGEEFITMVLEFFERGTLPKAVNTTWGTLIPKVEGATDLKDFRPISMVGCIYKIIAKIMATRLKRVMPFLVGETQSAFIMGRQILDGALIANEVVQWAKKNKKEVALMKLDFHKAYDTVKWSFIDQLLEIMGFGAR